jgi:hypothetical protein
VATFSFAACDADTKTRIADAIDAAIAGERAGCIAAVESCKHDWMNPDEAARLHEAIDKIRARSNPTRPAT